MKEYETNAMSLGCHAVGSPFWRGDEVSERRGNYSKAAEMLDSGDLGRM